MSESGERGRRHAAAEKNLQIVSRWLASLEKPTVEDYDVLFFASSNIPAPDFRSGFERAKRLNSPGYQEVVTKVQERLQRAGIRRPNIEP
jgi:hypothetical protein